MAFYTTNATTSTEKMRIESGGNVEVKTGNLVIGTAGKGIDFSNQASPAGGMTAEVLDHYEEGTWTPVLKDASDNGITSYHQNNGTYTRVGRAVSISGTIYCNDVSGPSGNLKLEGLPFTCVTTTAVAFGELRRTDRGSGNHTLIGNVPATTAYIALGVNDGDGTNNTGGLDASKIMTATQWHFSATYPV